jgi:hypothetical protein
MDCYQASLQRTGDKIKGGFTKVDDKVKERLQPNTPSSRVFALCVARFVFNAVSQISQSVDGKHISNGGVSPRKEIK